MHDRPVLIDKDVEIVVQQNSAFIKVLQYIAQCECRFDFSRPCMHDDTVIDEPCDPAAHGLYFLISV